jgi:pyridinium-3,5-biscarboxylic acid mononucleotide sulfurtransferase
VEELPFFVTPHIRLPDRGYDVSDFEEKCDRLLDFIREFPSCAVAFSAGVDSTVVAKAAQIALGDQAVAVTGVSASLAEGELDEAKRLAELIGIRHVIIDTREFENPQYLQNSPDRCYHCKNELFQQIGRIAPDLGISVVFSGANADDLGDYRPGLQAAAEHEVRSPLAECGFTKDDVRLLAARWELPVWDKPAMPCLASRVAYGEEVWPERLEMIDRAEQFLRRQGLNTVRVRYHQGDLARLEVPASDIERVCSPAFREPLVEYFKQLGFRFVTLDIEGFRSGSLNTLVPVEMLEAITKRSDIA